ncbi:glycosyltransferase [Rhodovarius lipocyclicus]|uniref:glycosyltransferase n=1 Tax=Rhodovarius lipocyclicus TaxID=268410 RepID=UPI00135708A9|nr:glycosyltransferase [Rhodovarius lipocyclicus]
MPDETPPLAAALQCSVDVFSAQEIAGWVRDPAAPERRVELELLLDDVPMARVIAANYRPDLEAAGIGDGRHGFSIRPVHALMAGTTALVRLRDAATGHELIEGMGRIIHRAGGFDAGVGRLLSGLVENSARRARAAGDLAPVITSLRRALALAEAAQAALPEEAAASTEYDASMPLHLPEGLPEVSVIIPAHNQWALTHACIASLIAHAPRTAFEVILVDDASTDGTAQARLSGNIRPLRQERNLGFIGACNAGAAAARGRTLLFLNNDTLATPGWLDEMLATFALDPAIGVVGAALLNEDGTLQESGGIVWRHGDAWNYGRNEEAEDPRYSFLRDADYVSGAALMLPAVLFRQLGGFDAHFSPAYYEDVDLCFRARAAGRRVVVQPAARIIHLEGRSHGTDIEAGVKRHQKLNQAKFRARWADVLASHGTTGQNPEQEAERSAAPRALFIDEATPTPDKDAGSQASVQHMRLLQGLGYRLSFVPSEVMEADGPYTTALERRGIQCFHAPYRHSVEEVLRRMPQPPDLIYLYRYGSADKYLGLARRLAPKATVIFSVCDLHFLRLEREAALEADPRATARAEAMRHAELALIGIADATIVHSALEASLLRELVPQARVHVVTWPVAIHPPPLPFTERRGSCFLGGFNHAPNADAVLWMGRELRPLLRGLPVTVYGSNPTPPVLAESHGDIQVAGFVPELAPALHRHRSAVAPLRYGAGIKGKVLDSLAHGLPCVMTAIAAEGLGLTGDLAWLLAEDAPGIAAKLHRLETDAAWNAHLSAEGLRFIADRFGEAAVRADFQAAIAAARV